MEQISYLGQINLATDNAIFDARNKMRELAALLNLDLITSTHLASEISELCRWIRQAGVEALLETWIVPGGINGIHLKFGVSAKGSAPIIVQLNRLCHR